MIKAIFFDFDGVLVESVDIKTNAFADLFAHEGSRVVRKVVDYHMQNAGVPRYDKFRYIYREILKRPLDDRKFECLCSRFAECVIDNVVSAPYVKGALEFLEAYSSRYLCFVTSATPHVELEEIILRRGMARFFRALYGAPTNKTGAVKEVLQREEIHPSMAVYIGDALSDYKAAQDNGIAFIAKINGNEDIFDGIDCFRIRDLSTLSGTIIAM